MFEDRAIKIPKLISIANYKLQAIQIKAALTVKDISVFLTRVDGAKSSKDDTKALGYIQLAYTDGPLIYILNIDNPINI